MEKALPVHLRQAGKPTHEGDSYTSEETEFLRACERERERLHQRFLKATDYLRVAKELGYERVAR